MKLQLATWLLPLAFATQAVASPIVVDELTGYNTYAASESIIGGNEGATLMELSSAAHIDGIQWAGIFSRQTEWTGNNDMQFVVRFYDDASNGPDALIAEQWLNPTFTAERSDTNWDGSYLYGGLFSGALDVNLNAGKVWVSILGKPSESLKFVGLAMEPNTESDIYGTGGALKIDPTSPWIPVNEGISFYEGRGAAIALEGTIAAVPEPTTYALMGLGLIMMGALVRARRA